MSRYVAFTSSARPPLLEGGEKRGDSKFIHTLRRAYILTPLPGYYEHATMSISTPFIRRPVATSLLTLALAMAGGLAFYFLPVAPLPQVEYPTLNVNSNLPGASPETMASAVTTPLERSFGRIAGISEMTSNSNTGNSQITIQFDLDRNIDAAARDVQAAIMPLAVNFRPTCRTTQATARTTPRINPS